MVARATVHGSVRALGLASISVAAFAAKVQFVRISLSRMRALVRQNKQSLALAKGACWDFTVTTCVCKQTGVSPQALTAQDIEKGARARPLKHISFHGSGAPVIHLVCEELLRRSES